MNHSALHRIESACARTFGLMLLSLFLSPLAAAQLGQGTIAGKVTDSSGRGVPGSHVVLSNLKTGVQSETITNKAGVYSIPNVQPGSYKAAFSMKGFKTAERLGIIVSVGQAVYLDVTLEIGQIRETVTVDADITLLTEASPLLATNIQGAIIKDLPLSFEGGRQIESFAYAMAPAAEGYDWTSYIAGTPAFTKEVIIDGLSATSQIQGNVLESSPTMESIGEFNVQTGASSAEYGHAGGGVFNFVLKPGTNAIHGSALYYGRNEALNANTWMNNWQLSRNPGDEQYKRARDRQSIFGAGVGGPVSIPGLYSGKNRTFLYGSIEHYRQERLQIGTLNRTVPIADFLEGNFSKLLTTKEVGIDALGRSVYAGQIFDPSTLRRINGQWVADPFPNNIIPPERQSSVSRKVIDIYQDSYKPMLPDRLTNNSAGPQYESPWFHQTQLTLKADHAFSPALKLTGSLIWTERPRILVDQGGVWNPLAAEGTGGPFARSRKQEVTSRALRSALNWNLRPNLISTTAFAFNRYRNPSMSSQSQGNWQKYLGLESSTSAGLFPEISFGPDVNGIGTTKIGYANTDYSVANNYILSETVDWNRGKHTVKFGGEIRGQQLNSHSGLDALSFAFSPTQTGIPGYSWSNRVGFGFASFFLGEASGGSKNVPFDLYGRRKYVALFVQDDYRIARNVTVNLGLRWEQSRPLHEKYGRWASFNPSLMNTNYDIRGALEFPVNPQSSFEKQKDWKEFGPHVGIAYRPGSHIVLRGGYSLSYIPLGMNYWSGVPYGFAPGYRGANIQTASPNLPKFNWDSGYPDNYQAPSKDPNTLVYGMVSVDERSLFAGYLHQYNASVQFELGADTIFETAFMGNQGRRLHNGALRRNQPSRAAYENPGVDPWAWVWNPDSAAAAGVSYPYYGFSNYAGVALQPFPQVASETYGPLYFVGTPKGSSGYTSFQLSVSKRMSHNVDLQISYNLSRAVGNSETGFEETWDEMAGIQDIYSLKESANTVLSYDQTHVLKGYVAYQLPFGRGQRFLANAPRPASAILGGWKITGIFRYNSGNPLSVTPNVWYPGWEGTVYADYDRSVNLSRKFNGSKFNPGMPNGAGNLYFDPSAFSNPTGHNLGNGKRLYSELRGFGYASEDIGIMKCVRIRERAAVQLRAEFLNAFNRHHFANPDTRLGNTTTFGYVTSLTGIPRIIQFGVRMDW
jgi:hypothetical protein